MKHATFLGVQLPRPAVAPPSAAAAAAARIAATRARALRPRWIFWISTAESWRMSARLSAAHIATDLRRKEVAVGFSTVLTRMRGGVAIAADDDATDGSDTSISIPTRRDSLAPAGRPPGGDPRPPAPAPAAAPAAEAPEAAAEEEVKEEPAEEAPAPAASGRSQRKRSAPEGPPSHIAEATAPKRRKPKRKKKAGAADEDDDDE